MESDEEDYVFFGTPIEREEEISSRKKKAVAEASGHLRTLPSWKQEVRDEEGRRRFHGAFTGGFSAGYYNTVGSKEGWAPQSFTSSRKNRAEAKKQSILNFLDEDEKEELEGRFLGTSSQFDTFGFTSAEIARKQAEKEQQQRPSIIPGPAPDEIVLPATESVGVKLLLKMGWRHGRSIKDSIANTLHDARREARRAFLAFSSDDPKVQLTDSEPIKGDRENVFDQPANDVQSSKSTPVYVLNPKQDLYGLGFDPYKNAPEFREKKRSRVSGERGPGYNRKDSLFGFKSGKIGPGFGIGALEELDAEDEDVYATGYEFEETYLEEDEESSNLSLENKKKLDKKHEGALPGFRVASNSDYRMDRFEAPVIPKDFLPHHTFPGPLEIDCKHYDVPPQEVPPPEDGTLKLLIEGVASLVARSGKKFEDLYREKNKSNPLFNFLSGGIGHDYYARKLWEACQKRSDQTGEHLDGKVPASVQRLTAESRGKILGEKPLEKSFQGPSSSVSSKDIHRQLNLSDTFTKSASFSDLPEVEKPFKDDPAKQERFEQFLKQKYEGGLRSISSSLASNMSEAARARERLDFEAAAEAMEKGNWGKGSKPSAPSLLDFSTAGVLQFTSGGPELKKDPQTEDFMAKKMYPKREEFQWRPSPLLCKRFDLIDPYMGKPPPAPRIRSKMDSFIFTSDFVKASKTDEAATGKKILSPLQQSENQNSTKDSAEHVTEVEVEVENVERPVDLYKAIFSDDSDEEVEDSNFNRVDNQEKKAEIANTALSRLIAGDFLESLGKELGLEVPPDKPYPAQKSQNSALEKETANANARSNSPKVENIKETSLNQGLPHLQDIAQEVGSSKSETIHGNMRESSSSKTKGTSMDDNSKLNGKKDEEDRKSKTPTTRRRDNSDSSRHHRHWSRDSGSDSSSDDRDRYSSRSKRKHKSSREKSKESRKHSSNHKHRRRESRSRSSHYGMEKSRSDTKREKKRKD
ncbi:hypothetical protein L6164_014441 [Bauhinia variegata]|uniref:Uncharacterized protein n=1 Tax=Bauhinia variegata TaxID=167791 RepID=A0ACB9NHK1_BAUVA|nr:hypothetical protein L6164_014441 [Bauhinia variegata]